MKSYNIKGTFHIKADMSLEETVKTINKVTNLNLIKDDSGYYEEFPAYSNHTLGIQFAVLGPPKLKYRVENVDYNKYDFMISDYFKFKNDEFIDLSPTIMKLLNTESELECYK